MFNSLCELASEMKRDSHHAMCNCQQGGISRLFSSPESFSRYLNSQLILGASDMEYVNPE
jgi:hypothetical protein